MSKRSDQVTLAIDIDYRNVSSLLVFQRGLPIYTGAFDNLNISTPSDKETIPFGNICM